MTLFSKIINGEIPSYKIAEDDKYYAFLDINPVQLGHTLVVPKREEDYIFDLNDDELSGLICFGKKVATALREVTACRKVGVAVVGLEVNHAHLHLIPINCERDMDFGHKVAKPSNEQMAEIARRVREAIAL